LSNPSLEDIKKGIESSILSGLIVNCHKTKLNTRDADTEAVIKDIFYELFENPSVKWMVRAYVLQSSLTRLKDDLAMFLRDYGLSSIAHGKLIELVDEWVKREEG